MVTHNLSFCPAAVQVPKEEGLPDQVVDRLKSYETVKDVPFKVSILPPDSFYLMSVLGQKLIEVLSSTIACEPLQDQTSVAAVKSC